MRELLDRAWPSLVALVGTVGVVIALLTLFGDNTDGGSGADDTAVTDPDQPGDAGSEDGAQEPDEQSDGGDDAGGADAEESPEPDPAESESDGSDESEVEPTPAPDHLRTPVGIANQTSVDGLELVAKERLEEGGWTVAATSPFTGTVPETTVYFPPGLEESARALARQFPEIGRVHSSFEGLNPNRLVIVLVEDYAEAVGE